MASSSLVVVGPLSLTQQNGYKVWEDPSFIKWRKRDPHVTLHCHDSLEGLALINKFFPFRLLGWILRENGFISCFGFVR